MKSFKNQQRLVQGRLPANPLNIFQQHFRKFLYWLPYHVWGNFIRDICGNYLKAPLQFLIRDCSKDFCRYFSCKSSRDLFGVLFWWISANHYDHLQRCFTDSFRCFHWRTGLENQVFIDKFIRIIKRCVSEIHWTDVVIRLCCLALFYLHLLSLRSTYYSTVSTFQVTSLLFIKTPLY